MGYFVPAFVPPPPLSCGDQLPRLVVGRCVLSSLLSSLLGLCLLPRQSLALSALPGRFSFSLSLSISLLCFVFLVVPFGVVFILPWLVGWFLHVDGSRSPFSGPLPIERLPVDTLSVICYLTGTVVPVRSTGGLSRARFVNCWVPNTNHVVCHRW